MKNIWMLAALFLGFACVGCSDKSDTEQEGPSEPQYDHVEVRLTLTASEGAQQMFTFSGQMIGFSQEEVVSAAEIQAVNYSSPTSLTFNMSEDAPAQATLLITAEKREGFQPSDNKVDVIFTAELVATAYDNQGNVLSSVSETISRSITNAESSEEFRTYFTGLFPQNRVIELERDGEGYKLISCGMAH